MVWMDGQFSVKGACGVQLWCTKYARASSVSFLEIAHILRKQTMHIPNIHTETFRVHCAHDKLLNEHGRAENMWIAHGICLIFPMQRGEIILMILYVDWRYKISFLSHAKNCGINKQHEQIEKYLSACLTNII